MTKARLPKGPRSALSQLFHMRDPYPLMLQLSHDYPDPMTCPILGQDPMVLTWNPEGIKAVFSADPATFTPGTPEALAVIVGRGSLFLKSGEEHKRARKLLMPPFHGERMRAYATVMQQTTLRWLSRLEPGVSVPILETAQGITLDVIIEAIFGEKAPARVKQLHDEILAVIEAFNPLIASFRFLQKEFGGFGPWAKFERRADALRLTMAALVQEKRRSPGEDILSLLLSARDEEGNGLPEQEIFEQLLTFVIAGHETTATTLAWALYELHRHPESLTKLRAELDAGAGSKGAPETLTKQPYLIGVCQETLRRHPPVPIVPRRCTRDFALGDYLLPEGQRLGVGVFMAHHREETYPQPFEFKPERFIDRTYSPFEFLPFGGGTRRCLGAAFAMYELQIVLGTLLENARFSLDEKGPIRSVFRIGTYGPETGVRMTLQPAASEHRP